MRIEYPQKALQVSVGLQGDLPPTPAGVTRGYRTDLLSHDCLLGCPGGPGGIQDPWSLCPNTQTVGRGVIAPR